MKRDRVQTLHAVVAAAVVTVVVVAVVDSTAEAIAIINQTDIVCKKLLPKGAVFF